MQQSYTSEAICRIKSMNFRLSGSVVKDVVFEAIKTKFKRVHRKSLFRESNLQSTDRQTDI